MTETISSPIAIVGSNPHDLSILREYADFWKIPYTLELSGLQSDQLTVTLGLVEEGIFLGNRPTIISPAGVEQAQEVARRFGLEVAKEDATVRLPVAPGIFVSLRTRLNQFSGPNLEPVLRDGNVTILHRIVGTSTHLLSVDLTSEFQRLIYDRLDEIPSLRFRILTRMPFSYSVIPAFLRNRMFKVKKNISGPGPEMLGPVECLRTIFLASLVLVSGKAIPRIGFWRKGKTHALAISHDVETQIGLEDGAGRLIEVEKDLDLRSTWNIPSQRYPLSSQLLSSLAKTGEVGGHDTRHDGRLLFEKDKAKVERLIRCKERLELLSKSEVRGFRAPLLQHGKGLLEAVGQAGYKFDSSVPSWEALSPTSLKPHGVGTVFPFSTSGIIEIPVSLPQDHQLIRVSGLGVSEAVDRLIEVSRWVKGVGGVSVLLVHPDYEFGQEAGQGEYRRLLESFRSEPECDIMTLSELTDWWAKRQRAHVRMTDGKLSLEQNKEPIGENGLDLELVVGYGVEGFKVERLVESKPIELGRGSDQ